VDRGERAAQPVGVRRHQDQMDVVGHQAPRPDCDIGGAAVLGQEVTVERVVGVGKENAGAAVATLGDMMRVTGNDDAGNVLGLQG
jgi:hypothetical protein